jgi:hypothetical protein
MNKWKWSDLMPGDIVRFTKEIESFYSARSPFWVAQNCGYNLIVKNVISWENQVEININECLYLLDASEGFGLDWMYQGIVFNIIKLKED